MNEQNILFKNPSPYISYTPSLEPSLFLPLLVKKEGEWTTNGGDGAAGARVNAQVKNLPVGNSDALLNNLYCYDIPELRMNKDKYNDKFTPQIKWSKQYWSTVLQGGRVSQHGQFICN